MKQAQTPTHRHPAAVERQVLSAVAVRPETNIRTEQRVRDVLDRAPGGRELEQYFFHGGQSLTEAIGTRRGLAMLQDPSTASDGIQKLHGLAESCPLNPDLLRGIMHYGSRTHGAD